MLTAGLPVALAMGLLVAFTVDLTMGLPVAFPVVAGHLSTHCQEISGQGQGVH